MESCCGCFQTHSKRKQKYKNNKPDSKLDIKRDSQGVSLGKKDSICTPTQLQPLGHPQFYQAQQVLTKLPKYQSSAGLSLRQVPQSFTKSPYLESKENMSLKNHQSQFMSGSNAVPYSRGAESNLDLFMNFSQSHRSLAEKSHFSQSGYPTYSIGPSGPSGVYAFKSFKYLCQNCQNCFQKVLLVDLNLYSEKDRSIYELQELFNSSQNIECECPYCSETVCLILYTNLIVGSQEQLEVCDGLSDIDNIDEEDNKAKQTFNAKSLDSYHKERLKSIGNFESAKGQRNDKKFYPQVLGHKTQRLRDTHRHAQVIFYADSPKQIRFSKHAALVATKATIGSSEDHMSNAQCAPFSDVGTMFKSPELNHKAEPDQCKTQNKELMKALMHKKMKRNKTFFELKIGHNNQRSTYQGADSKVVQPFSTRQNTFQK